VLRPAAAHPAVRPPVHAAAKPAPAAAHVSAPVVAASPTVAPIAPVQKLAQNNAAPVAADAPSPLPPTGVHFYSLHRAYGLTPDKVTTPTDRPLVLIGPPDNPPAQAKDDSDDSGKSDKKSDAEGADD
jgi:hypothetical protein